MTVATPIATGHARTPVERPLAVTMGEPAGIGPDILLMAWRDRLARALPPFVAYGVPALLAERAERLAIPLAIAECHDATVHARPSRR